MTNHRSGDGFQCGPRARGLTAFIVVAFGSTIAPWGAQAQSVAEFYRGKTVNMIIGYPTTGTNDHYARTVARHIGKHIPGNPRVIVRNMPGGGSMIAANHLFQVAPRDGTVISLLSATIPLEEALGTPNAKFKAAQFHWVGRMASGVNVTFLMTTARVKTIKDAFETEAVLAGTGRSGTPTIYPSVLNNVLGMKFKIVVGYDGSINGMLAMERGEVEGHSTSWEGLKAAHSDWVRDKKINIVVQYGLKRHPELPDIPTSVELGRTPEEVRILQIVANATEVGKMVLTTPGVPADRVQALRRAFDATIRDPEYIADMNLQRLDITPLSGEELQKIVEDVGAVPSDILDRVKAIYPLN